MRVEKNIRLYLRLIKTRGFFVNSSVKYKIITESLLIVKGLSILV